MSLACAPAARVVASSHRRAQRVQRAQNARALLRQPRRAVGGVRRGLVTKAQGNEVQVEEVVEERQVQPRPLNNPYTLARMFRVRICVPNVALVAGGMLSKDWFW